MPDCPLLHFQQVSTVKVVLLRYVKGQLDAASLRAAFEQKGIAVEKKTEAAKAEAAGTGESKTVNARPRPEAPEAPPGRLWEHSLVPRAIFS